MVLNLTSCSTKSDSTADVAEKTAVSEQTTSQESAPESEPGNEPGNEPENEPENEPLEDTPQEAESETNDQQSSRFNGLWVTNSSIGTLYYFDNGEVTCYTGENYNPATPDLHYKVAQREKYSVEEVTSADGDGLKAILESGNEYWLLDNYPDVLFCYWYDDNGELQLSGSSSLARVTDFSVDDLILEDEAGDQR